jgi:predicted nucleic acid-binding protein
MNFTFVDTSAWYSYFDNADADDKHFQQMGFTTVP